MAPCEPKAPTTQESMIADIGLTYDLASGNRVRAEFERLKAIEGCLVERQLGWPTEACKLVAASFDLHAALSGQRWSMAVYKTDVGVLLIELVGGYLTVNVATDAIDRDIEWVLDWLRQSYPPMEDASGLVSTTFWYYTQHGPRSSNRKISVPPWLACRLNYTEGTRVGLERLMNGFRPGVGGQLLLWHGVPGTGKTFALRALANEWRDWCSLHYFVDPEEFLGRAAYLIQALLEDETDQAPAVQGGLRRDERWRLMVLEDTGELLSADAKERMGQSLSRLLNTVDGLIGQGLRVLFLITTNDPLRSLHPAVSRPGRCAAEVEFAVLSAAEASEWLGEPVQASKTIAELYSMKDGREEAHPSRPWGLADLAARHG